MCNINNNRFLWNRLLSTKLYHIKINMFLTLTRRNWKIVVSSMRLIFILHNQQLILYEIEILCFRQENFDTMNETIVMAFYWHFGDKWIYFKQLSNFHEFVKNPYKTLFWWKKGLLIWYTNVIDYLVQYSITRRFWIVLILWH